MLGLFFVIKRFIAGILRNIHSAQFKALFLFVCVILLSGTFFYHSVEHWSYLDSFYFSVITLATVGYGDFTPQTPAGKIFTVFYILTGVGTLLSFITITAANTLNQNRLPKRINRKRNINER
jgi:voltage-gated potassium channel